MRWRRSPLVLLAAALGCGEFRGEEVVRGFRGYPWGTPLSDIPEVAGTEPVGERDGLVVHAADVEFLGRHALAGFYFHPRRGGLVEGYYVLPLDLEECEGEWARYEAALAQELPTLVREGNIPSRPEADRARYESDCEYFVYNGGREDWSVTFVNPERPRDRAGLWMKVVGRSLRMTVFYRGGAAQAWIDRVRGRPRREPRPLEPPPAAPPEPPDTLREVAPFGRA